MQSLTKFTSGNFYLEYDEYVNIKTYDKLLDKYSIIKLDREIKNQHDFLLKKIYKKTTKINIEYLIQIIHTILKNIHDNTEKNKDKILVTQLIMASIVDKTYYQNLYDLVEIKNFILNHSYYLIKSYLDLHRGYIIYFKEIDENSFKQDFENHILYRKLKKILLHNKLPLNEKNIVIISYDLYQKIENIFYKTNDKINMIQYTLIRYIVSNKINKESYKLIQFIKNTLPTILELHFKPKKSWYGFFKKIFCIHSIK